MRKSATITTFTEYLQYTNNYLKIKRLFKIYFQML